MSSRGASASLGGEKRSFRSRSPIQSRKGDEDRQEEKSSVDFISVMAQLRSIGGLPEGHKIRGFMAALEDDDLPAASSYKMPIGGASTDILANDIDSRVSSSLSGMLSHKVSKLLLYQGVRSPKVYRFEGEELTKAKVLNRHMTELAGLQSFDNLNKTNIIWSSTEAEDMEAAARSIMEATFWMEWWIFAMRSLALKSTDDSCLVRRLSLASARCQLLVAKTASTLCANIILKRRDAVLLK